MQTISVSVIEDIVQVFLPTSTVTQESVVPNPLPLIVIGSTDVPLVGVMLVTSLSRQVKNFIANLVLSDTVGAGSEQDFAAQTDLLFLLLPTPTIQEKLLVILTYSNLSHTQSVSSLC